MADELKEYVKKAIQEAIDAGSLKVDMNELINQLADGAALFEELDVDRPKLAILIPAIQSFAWAIDMPMVKMGLKNLMTSLFKKSRSRLVHPAFVPILQQMDEDEIRILEYVYHRDEPIPMLTLRILFASTGGTVDFFRYFSTLQKDVRDLEQKNVDAIPVKLSNLARLNLIKVHEDRKLTNDDYYKVLLDDVECQEIKNRVSMEEGMSWNVLKMFFDLTEFGKQFGKIVFAEDRTSDKVGMLNR